MGIVIKAPSARLDLYHIWEYIALDSPERATQWIDRLDEAFSLLADTPYMGRQRDDIQPGIRSFVVGRYVILYRPIDGGIEVVHIVHSAKDPGNWV